MHDCKAVKSLDSRGSGAEFMSELHGGEAETSGCPCKGQLTADEGNARIMRKVFPDAMPAEIEPMKPVKVTPIDGFKRVSDARHGLMNRSARDFQSMTPIQRFKAASQDRWGVANAK